MSLDVTQLELGPFPVNCYVVRTGGEEGVIIDPGWPGEEVRILGALGGARCAAVLITHGDMDHVGGVAAVAEATSAPVYMAEAERARLERANDFVPPGFDVTVRPYSPDVLLQGDETLELAGTTFQTLRVPGHTVGHLAYHAGGHLFSGDVLFAGSVGRTDRPGNSWEALLESIRTLMERFPPETVVHPGHGPETTLGRELETNPFLAELRAAPR
jgi:glyoxylase-like metal-dependent hydrolase (beta-lactamase superfamily II)